MSEGQKGTDSLQATIAQEYRNMKNAGPCLSMGLRTEEGTHELCDKHYDAGKTESAKNCAVCQLEAENAALRKNREEAERQFQREVDITAELMDERDWLKAENAALKKEQAAWRKFTDEANRTLDAADKRIASLVVEVEMKDKEVRKWKEAWQQVDDEAYQYTEELKSLREFCRTEIRKMPELLNKYKVSPPQCTCIKDKEMTCIVHPTTRSLKEYIARLVAIADAAELVLINTDKLFSEHHELKALQEGE